jgi:flagellar biosynthetic protein FlhB
MADKSEKTEQPTQKRVEKARKDGDFVSSREFVGALHFLAAIVILGSWGPAWFSDLQQICRLFVLRAFKREIDAADITQLGWAVAGNVFFPLCSAGALLVLLTLGVQLAITRFGFSFGRLMPKLSKLSPLGKLKNLPKQNLFATLQAAVTLAFCMLALYVIARRNIQEFYMLPLQPLDSGLQRVYSSTLDLLWNAVGVFMVFGCIDLFRQMRKHDGEMRMSRQEIRDEFKEAEGNPAIKARIRRLQRSARRRKMLREVESATAVVVNPTHYAVALRYTVGSTTAPMVVAKGRNHLALHIRRIATSRGIPLIENPPLAQALYKSAALDSEIPPHFYRAVAEVLAYVFQVLARSS